LVMEEKKRTQDGRNGGRSDDLERSLTEARSELKGTLEWLKDLEGTLDNIKSSVTWKLAGRSRAPGSGSLRQVHVEVVRFFSPTAGSWPYPDCEIGTTWHTS